MTRHLRVAGPGRRDATEAHTRPPARPERTREPDRRSLPEAISAATHELKTPLASLLGYARLLRKQWDTLDPDRRASFFDVIEQQGGRMLRLLEGLLEAARVDSGGGAIRRRHLDVAAIVASACATASGLARHHVIEASVPDGDLGLYGDPGAVEQVLINLLENAVKYSPAGTRVHLAVAEAESFVCFSVADEGPGIADADLPYVFERFRRGSDAAGTEGVGLGLHIVRSLVEAHNGTIDADSRADGGAVFTVRLPRRSPR